MFSFGHYNKFLVLAISESAYLLFLGLALLEIVVVDLLLHNQITFLCPSKPSLRKYPSHSLENNIHERKVSISAMDHVDLAILTVNQPIISVQFQAHLVYHGSNPE